MARNKWAELAPERKRKKRLKIIRAGIGCLLLALIPILIPAGFIIYSSIGNHYLRTEGVITEAVIIDEKNYFGNSPVSHDFSYSYQFAVDGKQYTGNSLNSKYAVGQIVKIKYVAGFPRFNEILKTE
ncbi:hypothetical protein GKZ68_06110 [Hymenobacter sp. BRD128]|uniref:hypothetical protein n=1 Tax=Hymenobacter sp. BRD128 TaxID=2675878 RepID=UPI001566D52E|nr:hypothetical protein [Hymenobacter sp. BRD128]QKG56253.1 hypothetical protein GKZ68_06110 [Hymenobacter sp. BRD128]